MVTPNGGGDWRSLDGKSFGLTKQQTLAVSYLLLAVKNCVEIVETRTLFRQPGVDLLMCGAKTAYTVRVEPQRLRLSLGNKANPIALRHLHVHEDKVWVPTHLAAE